MQNNDEKFEMQDIEKHLKAEAKIREVHSIIDDVMAADTAPPKNESGFNWKYLGWIAVLLFIGFGVFYWAMSNKKSTEKPPLPKENSTIKPVEQNQPMANETDKSSNNKTPFKTLLAANFSPVAWGIRGTRSLSNQAPENEKNIIKAKYNSGNYKETLQLLNPLVKKYPNDWELIFFKGVCQINTPNGNTESAIQSFEKIIEHDDNSYIEDAQWFLAAAYLQKNDVAKAKETLNKILTYPSEYNERAKIVLQELEW